jgi:hypothetical protein
VGLLLPVDRKTHALLFRPFGQKEEGQAAGVLQEGAGGHLLPVLQGRQDPGLVGADGLENLFRGLLGEEELPLLPGQGQVPEGPQGG